jgi:RNA polymerase sigma factor (sigma-70 family)
MPTDSELLRRYVDDRDEAAFSELVQRHLGIVFNAALRRVNGNRDLAEEAAQIVFAQLAGKAHRLVYHSALLGWLHTSTHFAASALIRRETRLAARQQIAAAMHLNEADPLDWETVGPLIDEALDQLRGHHRQAVLLRFFAARSYSEIGAELRVSENAARKCVERALEHLRRQFARRGVTTTTSALAMALSTAPAHAAAAPMTASVATAAMAGATGAASLPIPLSFVALMSTAKLSSVSATALALVMAGALGTGLMMWSQRQQREQLQLDALHGEAIAIQARLVKLRADTSAPRRAAVAITTNANPAAGAVSDVVRSIMKVTILSETSEVYAPVREQEHRLRFRHEYGAFLATRNYPPDKVEALQRAMAEYYHASRLHEAQMYLLNFDDATRSPETIRRGREILDADRQTLFQTIAASFTDAERQDIRRCFDSQQYMWIATTVGYATAYANAPLDRVQELALAMTSADAVTAARTATPPARRQLQQVDPSTGLSQQDRNLLDDAVAFLSPAQRSIYENYLRLEHVRNAAYDRAHELVSNATPKS